MHDTMFSSFQESTSDKKNSIVSGFYVIGFFTSRTRVRIIYYKCVAHVLTKN